MTVINNKEFKHHPNYILIKLLQEWKSVFGILFFLIIIVDLPIEWIIVGSIVIYFIFYPLYFFFSWKKTEFILSKESIKMKSGILIKRNQTIPINKITNVDIERQMIHRIFCLNKVTIENGSNDIDKNDITIFLVNEEAVLIKELLQKNTHELQNTNRNESMDLVTYEAALFDLFLFGSTKSSIASLIGVTGSIYLFADDVMETFSIDSLPLYKSAWELIIQSIEVLAIIVLIVLCLSKLITMGSYIVKYYNFKAVKHKQFIEISYGLITKKHFVIPIEKIFAVRKKQTILFQLLKKESVEIAAVGYGNEEKSNIKSIFIPVINSKHSNQLIEQFLPNYKFEEEITRVERTNFVRFFVLPGTMLLIAFFTCLFIYPKLSYIIVILGLFILLNCFLQAKHTGIGLDEVNIYTDTGGFYRTKTISAINGIQFLSKEITPFQKNSNICHIIITPRNGRNIVIKHIDEKIKVL